MPPRYRFSTIDFLGVPMAVCTTGEFIRAVLDDAAAPSLPRPAFITYVNAWCSNISARDSDYRALLHQADCVYADGQAIVWASRFLGTPLPERVNAADFILDFCREAARRGLSLYLLGGPEGVAAGAAKKFLRSAPGLRVLGAEYGYFSGEAAEQAAIERIAQASPDILIVGMGVPHQEKWVWRNLDRFRTRAVWCVGAMFEYHAGYRARAPRWVRHAGLEWAFRLMLEPRRLWRRYIIGNTVFIARVLAARLRGQRP